MRLTAHFQADIITSGSKNQSSGMRKKRYDAQHSNTHSCIAACGADAAGPDGVRRRDRRADGETFSLNRGSLKRRFRKKYRTSLKRRRLRKRKRTLARATAPSQKVNIITVSSTWCSISTGTASSGQLHHEGRGPRTRLGGRQRRKLSRWRGHRRRPVRQPRRLAPEGGGPQLHRMRHRHGRPIEPRRKAAGLFERRPLFLHRGSL